MTSAVLPSPPRRSRASSGRRRRRPIARSRSSAELTGLDFTGRHAEYTDADTWYPSWAADGKLYSPFTDGRVDEIRVSSAGKDAATGQAVIEGDDPLQLKIRPLGIWPGSPAPYEGRYPCGTLVHNGVWYYGTYALLNAGYGLNWPVLGPTPGFYVSKDFGKTWTNPPAYLRARPGALPRAGPQGRPGQDRRAPLRRFRPEHGALARRQGLPGRARRDAGRTWKTASPT